MKINLHSFFRQSGDRLVKAPHIPHLLIRRKGYNALTEYVHAVAADKNAVELFDGDWVCHLPPREEAGHTEKLNAGSVISFAATEIIWANKEFGGFQGKRILELGPMEGGHSYLLQKQGAASVLAIEANRRSFLKCLIVKNIYGLDRVKFLLGDFVEWMKNSTERFDVCIASGVLYHMMNPVELISLISERTDAVYLWTHYYDAQLVASNPCVARSIGAKTRVSYKGFAHDLYAHSYEGALDLTLFLGGPATGSQWMAREDILNALRHFGFNDLQVAHEEPHHPGGPCFGILARRKP